MPNIKDIARAAGVSPASVSRVINNGPKVGRETRERIKQVMRDMGYSPNANAQAINDQNNTSIGIVLADLVDPFFSAMAHGIEQVATLKNVQIFMNSGAFERETELRAIETLLEHRYKAMVIHSSALEDNVLIGFARKVPGLVLINRYIDEIAERCVWLDDAMGGQLMADYICSQGHSAIAIIDAPNNLSNSTNRLSGALTFLKQRQLSPPIQLIEHAEATYEGGRVAVQNLLASGIPFSAILAHNDAMAIGAISMLDAQGINVPDDVSVIGFDDLMLARCIKPKLTTINNPIEEMAIKATELALANSQQHTGNQPRMAAFKPELVIRQSVKGLR
ncbi:LacI family DNA-binding transcriptional regulator [Paraglaciecola sp.]|uniref:LacI family DNA-binding transcriptional regulator n=1 Tax=Paraglaciecola sp. TaxID=1920173 RepID=UPI00273E620A|nr:LacI family DNA-binding transcriptional regulator [Paraglaciecola sp.]MDP5033304.1 LacI family DNA-binding transcriptional regulator [Paraglaciecola sp.]